MLDERARHELYLGVEEVLGTQRADTLMSLLPPVGWADVATRDDLRQLEERMDMRFAATKDDIRLLEMKIDSLDLKFESLDLKIDSKVDRAVGELTRTLMFGLIGSVFTIGSICLAAIAVAT